MAAFSRILDVISCHSLFEEIIKPVLIFSSCSEILNSSSINVKERQIKVVRWLTFLFNSTSNLQLLVCVVCVCMGFNLSS